MQLTVTCPIAPGVPATTFTADQWEALLRMRERYTRDAPHVNQRELAYLRFLRWLYWSGRLTS
jgi:hypothetical protein